jgi:hypothetical protein
MPRERDPEVTLFGDRGLLAALVAPLFATLSALLGVLGGDVGRQSLDAAQSWARLSHLVADGVPSGGVVPLLGGVLVGVRRFLKMS